jgi:ribonuclease HI
MSEISIFTDGSCWPNPNGTGGWAFVAMIGPRVEKRYGHMLRTTNNEAELEAIHRALRFVKMGGKLPVSVTTDSRYAFMCLSQWRHKWAEEGWVNGLGLPVSNRLLIERIGQLLDEHRKTREVFLHHIRGHQGDALNEMADVLAGDARVKKITDDRGCTDVV